MFKKNNGKIEFKVENDNIKKVLRNYENNFNASMSGRNLFGHITE